VYLHLIDPPEEEGREALNELAQPGTLFDGMFPPRSEPPSGPNNDPPRDRNPR
jgi:integrase/recombinase XerD